MAFVSVESTSSTNEFNVAYSVSIATCYSSQAQGKNQLVLTKPRLSVLTIFARDCRIAKNSGNRSRDARNAGYRGRDNGKRPTKEEDEKALVVQDGLGTYDWSYQVKEESTDFALMAFTSNPLSYSSSNSEENSLANDRFKKGEGYHAVPPPLNGNYMPPKPNVSFAGLDDSIYKFKISETVTGLAKDEKDAPETSTVCVENPKKDRSSALFIQDWDTDSDNDSVFRPEHIHAKIDFVKADEFVKHVKPIKSVKHVNLSNLLKLLNKLKNLRISVQVLNLIEKIGMGK
uniref:Uncharacterized protein n=1 Tax=Tanacetum cinerariifolium TaxID=118510 RepID=A0A699KSG4_TANCI|nr:hypothetical protein [Tanacetum cinerariifolium]